jgi:two-component system, response regulator FlrC
VDNLLSHANNGAAMHASHILVVEDDPSLSEAICDTLTVAGYTATSVGDGVAALEVLQNEEVALIIADVQMPRLGGHGLLQRVRAQSTQLPVLLMTAFGTIQDAVAAMRDGAVDYLVKPFDAQALTERVGRFVPKKLPTDDDLIAVDPRSLQAVELARRVAVSEATVMIGGESGTGKEVFARFIHRHSRRSQAPLVAINCAAIPETMLEAMLFGYEKGAFTGALQSTPGKFEQANGGTLLLDEISEMDLGLQAKLLRVLQEREVERLGGRKAIALDVRVLATSNRMMREEVAAGRFREDLFYRLNVFPVYLPPLRDRPADIVPIATSLLASYAAAEGRCAPSLTERAKQHLTAYTWPGNVRELGNVIQRALIMQCGDTMDAQDLPLEIATFSSNTPTSVTASEREDLVTGLKSHEQQLILETIKESGSYKQAAARLGISPRTLRYKLARLRAAGVTVPRHVGI